MSETKFELEIPYTKDNDGKGIYHHQLGALLKRALETYIEYGHIDHEKYHDEDYKTAELLIANSDGLKVNGVRAGKDAWYENQYNKLSLLCSNFERSIAEECNTDPEKLDILARVTNPFIRDYTRWLGVPLWGMTSKVVDKGDGLYKIEHNKDIDSSG